MALQIPKWIRRYLRWKDPFRKGAQEASDQYLGKAGKLQTINDMIMTRDLRDLSESDHEGVRALRAKHGFGTKKRGGFMGMFGGKDGDRDIIAADDMTVNAGSNGVLAMALGAILALIAAWFFLNKAETPAAATPPALAELPDSEYDIRFFDREGNQITVPRLPSRESLEQPR